MSDELIHRDDVPADLAEEIVKNMKDDFPGCRIVFAGDYQGLPPQAVEEARKEQARIVKVAATRFYKGQCFECGADMPMEWPPKDDEWELPTGWGICTETYGIDDIPILICPECED